MGHDNKQEGKHGDKEVCNGSVGGLEQMLGREHDDACVDTDCAYVWNRCVKCAAAAGPKLASNAHLWERFRRAWKGLRCRVVRRRTYLHTLIYNVRNGAVDKKTCGLIFATWKCHIVVSFHTMKQLNRRSHTHSLKHLRAQHIHTAHHSAPRSTYAPHTKTPHFCDTVF